MRVIILQGAASFPPMRPSYPWVFGLYAPTKIFLQEWNHSTPLSLLERLQIDDWIVYVCSFQPSQEGSLLHAAAILEDPKMAFLLIANGANIHALDEVWLPGIPDLVEKATATVAMNLWTMRRSSCDLTMYLFCPRHDQYFVDFHLQAMSAVELPRIFASITRQQVCFVIRTEMTYSWWNCYSGQSFVNRPQFSALRSASNLFI